MNLLFIFIKILSFCVLFYFIQFYAYFGMAKEKYAQKILTERTDTHAHTQNEAEWRKPRKKRITERNVGLNGYNSRIRHTGRAHVHTPMNDGIEEQIHRIIRSEMHSNEIDGRRHVCKRRRHFGAENAFLLRSLAFSLWSSPLSFGCRIHRRKQSIADRCMYMQRCWSRLSKLF